MSNVERYNAIRETIISNLMTIKFLLDQANSLHEVVKDLDDNVEPEEKQKLTDSVNNIYKSIDLLTVQTDSLFQTFIDYANSTESISR
jgi:hypothetical protein